MIPKLIGLRISEPYHAYDGHRVRRVFNKSRTTLFLVSDHIETAAAITQQLLDCWNAAHPAPPKRAKK